MSKKFSFLLVVLVIVAGYLGGMTYGVVQQAFAKRERPLRQIEALAFNLVDEQGKVRGSFTFDKNGVPVLGIKGNGNNYTTYLTSGPSGSTFVMRDERGQTRIGVRVDDVGNPMIILNDKKLLSRLVIRCSEDGAALALSGRNGKPGLEIGLDAKLGPHLAMKSEHGDYLAYLGIPVGSTPNLGFFQGTQPIWSPAQSGANLPAPELPPMDDMMRELTR